MSGEEVDILHGLGAEDAERVLGLGTSARARAGEVLFELGAAADRLYVLKRGRVALTLPMLIHGEEEHVQIEERTPGQTFGWSALVPPHRFTLKATALVESEVISLPRIATLEHFQSRPEVGFTVIRNISSVIGRRLGVVQAMWIREVQRAVDSRQV